MTVFANDCCSLRCALMTLVDIWARLQKVLGGGEVCGDGAKRRVGRRWPGRTCEGEKSQGHKQP